MPSKSDWVQTNDVPQLLAEEGVPVVRSQNARMVAEFRRAFDLPMRAFPAPLDADLDLHARLIAEETSEFLVAVREKNPVEILDALADLMYVIYGAALDCGFDIDAAFSEVHRSNMSKLGADGRPILNEVGKVQKGPNYSPPDLRGLAGQ